MRFSFSYTQRKTTRKAVFLNVLFNLIQRWNDGNEYRNDGEEEIGKEETKDRVKTKTHTHPATK